MAIITVSRGTFSGGKALAEYVSQKLGYKCISREILLDAASQYNVPVEALSQALNDKPGILEGMSLARTHYLAYIQTELIKAVRDENTVYHGLAGQMLLQNVPHVLKVRVIASIEFRIQAAMERTNLTRPDAIEFIKAIDAKRDRWVKFLYHVDRNDPSLYDLVINLDRVGLTAAGELVCTNARQSQFQPTAESHRRLSDLALASEVRARIAADAGVKDTYVKVDANDGVVAIAGKVSFLGDADRARAVALSTPGVKDINSRMEIGAFSQALGQF